MRRVPEPVISREQLQRLIERIEARGVGQDEWVLIGQCVTVLIEVLEKLEEDEIALRRLKRILFGSRTERRKSKSRPTNDAPASENEESTDHESSSPSGDSDPVKKKKGHGRLPAQAYENATVCPCGYTGLKAGDQCPACGRGTLRKQKPVIEIRVTGQPPLGATRYELERFRCDTCGEVFTATLPPEADVEKYSASAKAMVCILKYGYGMPFHRLKYLQHHLGIPLPEATQYELITDVIETVTPVFEQLWLSAARAEVLFIDDSPMKILEPIEDAARQSTQTTIMVARCGSHWAYLYQTGWQHAGENVGRLLEDRPQHLLPPIQMSDALAANKAHPFKVLLVHCIVHARRLFFDIEELFPEVCSRVLETIAQIYKFEKKTSDMDAGERLKYHKANSLPLLEDMRDWLAGEIEECRIEPNSSLGKAVKYFLKHWEALTGFCRIPKAPLDNTRAERGLKMAILNRKNAYFFKTARGAQVGSRIMSLIKTAIHAKANPLDYLVALQQHSARVKAAPELWLPWNYQLQMTSCPASPPGVAIAAPA